MLSVVRIHEKLQEIEQPWQPRVVGTINDFHVKVVRLEGSFLWHHHETEDELFLVVSGTLKMLYRDGEQEERSVTLGPGEFVIVPHGTEHCPVAECETNVVLFERATTLNTGTTVNERTYVDGK